MLFRNTEVKYQKWLQGLKVVPSRVWEWEAEGERGPWPHGFLQPPPPIMQNVGSSYNPCSPSICLLSDAYVLL